MGCVEFWGRYLKYNTSLKRDLRYRPQLQLTTCMLLTVVVIPILQWPQPPSRLRSYLCRVGYTRNTFIVQKWAVSQAICPCCKPYILTSSQVTCSLGAATIPFSNSSQVRLLADYSVKAYGYLRLREFLVCCVIKQAVLAEQLLIKYRDSSLFRINFRLVGGVDHSLSKICVFTVI